MTIILAMWPWRPGIEHNLQKIFAFLAFFLERLTNRNASSILFFFILAVGGNCKKKRSDVLDCMQLSHLYKRVCRSVSPLVRNPFFKLKNLLENHPFQKRLSHLYGKETFSIHWSIYLLVCQSVGP